MRYQVSAYYLATKLNVCNRNIEGHENYKEDLGKTFSNTLINKKHIIKLEQLYIIKNIIENLLKNNTYKNYTFYELYSNKSLFDINEEVLMIEVPLDQLMILSVEYDIFQYVREIEDEHVKINYY